MIRKGNIRKMKSRVTLAAMQVGECLTVLYVESSEEVRRRLFDLGFAVGERIRCVGESPLGDPVMLTVGGRVIAMRRRDLKNIYGLATNKLTVGESN